jgi:hypothetical protein
MNQHEFKEAIKINGVAMSFGPHHYAYYEYKDSWRESASITNLYLKELLHRVTQNESN